MRYELATPLLFANVLRWIAPDIFRRRELIAGSVGAVTAAIGADINPSAIRVAQEDGSSEKAITLPFTVRNRSLQFFAGAPGIVRVTGADRDLVYSLVLPEVSESKWEPPAGVRRGIPPTRQSSTGAVDLWQALACLGAAGLLLDWFWFGRYGRTAKQSGSAGSGARYTLHLSSLPGFRRKPAVAGRGRS